MWNVSCSSSDRRFPLRWCLLTVCGRGKPTSVGLFGCLSTAHLILKENCRFVNFLNCCEDFPADCPLLTSGAHTFPLTVTKCWYTASSSWIQSYSQEDDWRLFLSLHFASVLSSSFIETTMDAISSPLFTSPLVLKILVCFSISIVRRVSPSLGSWAENICTDVGLNILLWSLENVRDTLIYDGNDSWKWWQIHDKGSSSYFGKCPKAECLFIYLFVAVFISVTKTLISLVSVRFMFWTLIKKYKRWTFLSVWFSLPVLTWRSKHEKRGPGWSSSSW